jgi:hypothetical protein
MLHLLATRAWCGVSAGSLRTLEPVYPRRSSGDKRGGVIVCVARDSVTPLDPETPGRRTASQGAGNDPGGALEALEPQRHPERRQDRIQVADRFRLQRSRKWTHIRSRERVHIGLDPRQRSESVGCCRVQRTDPQGSARHSHRLRDALTPWCRDVMPTGRFARARAISLDASDRLDRREAGTPSKTG